MEALMVSPYLEPVVLDEVRGEIHHQYLSSEAARSDLGWQPGAPVAERLRETIEWYRSYLGGKSAKSV